MSDASIRMAITHTSRTIARGNAASSASSPKTAPTHGNYQGSWPHGGGVYTSKNKDRLTTDVARFWVVIALVIFLLVLVIVARRKP